MVVAQCYFFAGLHALFCKLCYRGAKKYRKCLANRYDHYIFAPEQIQFVMERLQHRFYYYFYFYFTGVSKVGLCCD
jgi:hypothetical protein